MRKKVVAGNWKMNMLPNEAMTFINQIASKANNSVAEVILCVPYTDLFYSLLTAQDTKIKIGAQNMHWAEKGAYTGEISGSMLKCIGVEYVIVGHSERREQFAETDEIINKKVKTALANELKPIICIGETLEQKENGQYEEVVTNQIQIALQNVPQEQMENIIIAYEPIWAIGTGKTATATDANNAVKTIRKYLQKIYNKEIAENITILYGGSIKAENSKQLFSMSDIDGGLIGGASLDVSEFSKILLNIK